MNEQQIRAIVKDEISKEGGVSTYNTLNIPRHVHNGVDSPLLTAPTITYGGYVAYDGISYIGTLLPKGWSVTTDGTGVATVIHNLNTSFYIPSAVAIQSTGNVVATVISPFVNECTFSWFDVTAPPAQLATGFAFLIVVLVNNLAGTPQYKTT